MQLIKKLFKISGMFIAGIFVLALVMVIIDPQPSSDTASKSETKTEVSKSPSSKPTKEEDSTPTLGSKVRDGKFEFVVKSIKCGIKSVETYKTNTPLGEYCKVTVNFTNIGDKGQYVDATDQVLIDSKGREFKASIGSDSINFENINPGLSVTGDIYFDVPVGTKVKAIELHDSMFSGGVEVRA